MNMMKCPKCGREIEGDVEFCYHCGWSIIDNTDAAEDEIVYGTSVTNSDNETDPVRRKIDSPDVSLDIKRMPNQPEQISTVGGMIKIVAVVVLIFSLIGAIAIWATSGAVTGIACILISLFTSLLAYGVGEIVCLLKEISLKLR